jgi:2-iminobutanoate/2-iminopropanoate deaminase
VVKTSIFLKDMNDFPKVNAIYGSVFSEGNYPARETVQVSRLPKDALVEISVVCVK